jgi:hypothetical protein
MNRESGNPFSTKNHAAFLLLAVFATMIFLGSIKTVRANVPSVLQIENLSQGTAGRIRLHVSHLAPTGSHFVDMVEVDVGGQVKSYGLQSQNTDPFTVELDLGQLQGTPNVKARVRCTVHGWSSWSNEIRVPEFSNLAVAILAVLTAALVITRRNR